MAEARATASIPHGDPQSEVLNLCGGERCTTLRTHLMVSRKRNETWICYSPFYMSEGWRRFIPTPCEKQNCLNLVYYQISMNMCICVWYHNHIQDSNARFTSSWIWTWNFFHEILFSHKIQNVIKNDTFQSLFSFFYPPNLLKGFDRESRENVKKRTLFIGSFHKMPKVKNYFLVLNTFLPYRAFTLFFDWAIIVTSHISIRYYF